MRSGRSTSAPTCCQSRLVRKCRHNSCNISICESRDTTPMPQTTSPDLPPERQTVRTIMWNETKSVANVNPNPIIATVVVGMNDVLNRQGYTQAARLNRIPVSAWALMFVIALLANFLIGFTGKKAGNTRLLIVPLAVSISFLLIADIDSPQGGIIRIQPQNLQILADSLRPK